MHGVRHGPDTFGGGATVKTRTEMIRHRRQMLRRIREVVAERRISVAQTSRPPSPSQDQTADQQESAVA
jgi:hypothetical protein